MTEAWTKTQTRRLIQLYREHPDLYNPYHPNYLRKSRRKELLLKIQQQLNIVKPAVSILEIKAKIKTLQNQLSKERGRMQEFIARGKSSEKDYKPKLWCYEELLFLKPTWCEAKGTPNAFAEETDGQVCSDRSQDGSDNSMESNDDVCGSPEEILELCKISEKCLDASEVLLKMKSAGEKSKVQIFCDYLSAQLEEIQLDETLDNVIIEVIKSLYEIKKKERSNLN